MTYTPNHIIKDVVTIKPKVFGDERGYFLETYNHNDFRDNFGYTFNFIQDNESKSSKGVLRGLHYQLVPYTQTKLIRVIKGHILDVAVDIREGSETFGKYVSVHLTDENKYQLLVPQGFAHGFVVLSDEAIVSYKVDNKYAPDLDRGIAWDDPDLGIDWVLPKEEIILSDKDKRHSRLKDAIRL